jgi:hypothetical protein
MRTFNLDEIKTDFLPPMRSGFSIVEAQTKKIAAAPLLEEIFSRIPLMFQILNSNRQVVYMNSLLKKELEQKGIEYGFGYRPGEILQCQHAFENSGGCGTTQSCQHCNIVNCVLEALTNNNFATREASFISTMNGKSEMINYMVSSKPFFWQSEQFVILTFENISDIKRKEQLEFTFFHDLLNKVTTISGISEILGMDPEFEHNPYIEMLKRGIIEMADEIRFQRNISQAENGVMELTFSNLSSLDLLKQQQEDFSPYKTQFNKEVIIDQESSDVQFLSDKVLVKRILNNLIKNALEAINMNETVLIGSKTGNNYVVFWIKNNVVLSSDVKSQIFNRSFSTKGAGRGTGTYSVKLFTEKYLKGKAYFTSQEGVGTIFYVKLPLEQPEN